MLDMADAALTGPPRAAAPPFRLAIFDFDGTLADSGEWFLSIADDLAERFRYRKVPREDVDRLRAMTSREVIRYLGVSRWRLPAISRHVHARFAENIGSIRLFDGVSDLLARLDDAGITLAIVTSNAEANARALLGPETAARIRHWECGASLFGKAAKFKRVLRDAGVRPHEAISIGDETRDLAAARKAGVTAAAALWGYASRDILNSMAPDVMFESPQAIGDLLVPSG